MSLFDAYRQKLEIQIQEHKARLQFLKAKARQAAAQSQIELARADKHLDRAKAKFNELKGAGGHALADISAGVKKALADLQVSSKKAAAHFNSHSAPRPRRPRKSAKTRKR